MIHVILYDDSFDFFDFMRTTTPHRFLFTLALFAVLAAAPFGQARGQNLVEKAGAA
ncbi:MAG: hypothetical protein ACHQNE_07360 [Candidatus Kapaibacterium sp.]